MLTPSWTNCSLNISAGFITPDKLNNLSLLIKRFKKRDQFSQLSRDPPCGNCYSVITCLKESEMITFENTVVMDPLNELGNT